MQSSPLLTAALQDRLAAGWYQCNYTYEEFPFIQGAQGPTLEHCNTLSLQMQFPLLRAAVQIRLDSKLVPLQIHL